MQYLMGLWSREPARVVAFVQMALLVAVTVFGVNLSGEQQLAIMGLVAALIALLGGEITRSQVSPA